MVDGVLFWRNLVKNIQKNVEQLRKIFENDKRQADFDRRMHWTWHQIAKAIAGIILFHENQELFTISFGFEHFFGGIDVFLIQVLRQKCFVEDKVDEFFFVSVFRELCGRFYYDGMIGSHLRNFVAFVPIFSKFINSFLPIFFVDDGVENGLSQRHTIVNYVFGNEVINQFHFSSHRKSINQI